MIRNAFRAVKTLLVRIGNSDPGRAFHVGTHRRGYTVQEREAEAFERALAPKMGQSTILAGSLELVGLDDVRNIMGDAWPSIATQVSEIAVQELQRCLDPSDIFRPHGEASFLIHFEGLDKVAAENKAQRTALRIKAALITQVPEIAAAISVQHFVVKVDTASLQDGENSLADALFSRLLEIRKEAECFLKRDRRSFIKDLQVHYSPVWHTQKQATVLNRSLLNTGYAATSLTQFQDLADPDQVAASHAEVDYLTLTQSLEGLHRVLQAGRSAMILVPVALGTILHPAAVAEYLRLLATVPEGYQKFVIIEICAGESALPAPALLQIAGLLQRYVKYVAIELPLEDPRIEPVVSGSPWAISLDLSSENSSDSRLPARLRQFTGAANFASVNTMAHRADTIGLAVAATEAGFSYVDGSAIHLPLREPRPPISLRPLPRSSAKGTVWTQPR